MPQKIAIAVIHGMGSQGDEPPRDKTKPTFSKGLYRKLRKSIGAAKFDQRYVWREVFWSDILQEPQGRFLRENKGRISSGWLRDFVLHRLADAAGYRKTGDDKDTTYERIHQRVEATLQDLQDEVGENGRLVVIAHSLGGHIMSNYIYDVIRPDRPTPLATAPQPRGQGTDFLNLKTLAGFVTFGCNIPIFTFAYKREDIKPIWRPGIGIPTAEAHDTWWWNYYDRNDVLGYPLSRISPGYEALAASGELVDAEVDVGVFPVSATLFSHNHYWQDRDFYLPVKRLLEAT